jgi:hypothetical protein
MNRTENREAVVERSGHGGRAVLANYETFRNVQEFQLRIAILGCLEQF